MINYEEAAKQEYDKEADQYAMRDEEKWKNPGGTALMLKKTIDQINPERILELGAGTGRYFPYLRGSSYTGIDISEKMLGHANQRKYILLRNGFKEISLRREEIVSFLDQQTPARKYDFIFSIGCLGYHICITLSLMRNIYMHLKPGGYLFLQTTQQSQKYKLQKLAKHWKNILIGKDDNSTFFISTPKNQIKKLITKTGLTTVWWKEDEKNWFNSPLLLSLHQKPVIEIK